MTTLILEHVPDELIARIRQLAAKRQSTPSATAVELLDGVLRPVPVGERVPDEPFLTDEISAPFDIPRPVGRPIFAKEIPKPYPDLRNLVDEA